MGLWGPFRDLRNLQRRDGLDWIGRRRNKKLIITEAGRGGGAGAGAGAGAVFHSVVTQCCFVARCVTWFARRGMGINSFVC